MISVASKVYIHGYLDSLSCNALNKKDYENVFVTIENAVFEKVYLEFDIRERVLELIVNNEIKKSL